MSKVLQREVVDAFIGRSVQGSFRGGLSTLNSQIADSVVRYVSLKSPDKGKIKRVLRLKAECLNSDTRSTERHFQVEIKTCRIHKDRLLQKRDGSNVCEHCFMEKTCFFTV